MPSTEWLRTRIISRCASFLDWVKALKITLVANAHQLVSTVTSFGASPIIRIPWNEEWMIKRALDAGAQGVMTPMCHSAVSLQFLPSFEESAHSRAPETEPWLLLSKGVLEESFGFHFVTAKVQMCFSRERSRLVIWWDCRDLGWSGVNEQWFCKSSLYKWKPISRAPAWTG